MAKHSSNSRQSKSAQTKTAEADKLYIGVDVGDQWSHVCCLDASGHIQWQNRIKTTPQEFRKFFAPLSGSLVALETGTHCGWMSRILKMCSIDVTVANARELRKIHQNDRKNDRADAEILARLLRADPQLLSPVQPRGEQFQNDLAILRARDVLVRSRARCVNAARGLAKASGFRLPACSAESFGHRMVGAIPASLEPALQGIVETVEALTKQIRHYDAQINELATKKYPKAQLVQQIDGVGALTAVAFILTLGDHDRFTHSRDVGPFLGLVPRQFDSGEHQSQLPITKAGNSYMRKLLVQAAHYILGPFGPDCRLRRYGERLAQRGGRNAKKRAIVAVARKTAVLMHHLWSTADSYQPLYGDISTTAA